MQLSSASAQAKPGKRRNSVVFGLLGLIVCYQAAYQIYMSRVLRSDAGSDSWCDGSPGSSQQCVEAQLFRGWQKGAPEYEPVDADQLETRMEGLLQQPRNTKLVNTSQLLLAVGDSPANASLLRQGAFVGDDAGLETSGAEEGAAGLLNRTPAYTPWAKRLVALQERLEERMRGRMAERAAKLHARSRRLHARHTREARLAVKEWHNMSALGHDLRAFGERLAQRRNNTLSAEGEWNNLTVWARDLKALQQHLEAHFTPRGQSSGASPAPRAEVGAAPPTRAPQGWATSAPGAGGPPLLEQIASLGRELCSDPQHHGNPKCAPFAPVPPASAAAGARPTLHPALESPLDDAEAQLHAELRQLAEKHESWEKSFVEKVSTIGRDLCSDPRRRRLPSCAQFLAGGAAESGGAGTPARKEAWHRSFAAKIASVGQELCSTPFRREYRICKEILAGKQLAENASDGEAQQSAGLEPTGQNSSVDGESAKNLSASIELHWSKVTQRSVATRGLRGSKEVARAATISDAEMHRLRTAAHWSGRIPSVACVTLVPKSNSVKAWMHYFIDNFRLQNYEGGRQLVLVYHHTDLQSAELVRHYADGTFIRGAVARGDEFPSAAAFRFGAWLARDADVVARWDFGAWHHPRRLSLQVRALAASGRPACLLERWTILDKAGDNTTALAGEHWDSSLVGEAAWMRGNWFPHMAETRAAFDAHAARDVVRLDAPGLEVFEQAAP